MSSDEGSPVKPKDRSFHFVEKIARLEGTVETLLDRIKFLEEKECNSETVHSITMAAKNKLSFSGRIGEDVDDLITQLKYLKLANNWKDEQLYGQCLVTFRGDCLRWFQGQDEETQFYENGKPSFVKLSAALKARFKKDLTEGDILYKIFDLKQKRGESVDDYMSKMFKEFAELKDVKDEVKVSLLINGFLPTIRDQLKLKSDLKLSDVELWARRVQDMSFVKSSGSTVNVVEESDCGAQVNAQVNAPGVNTSSKGPCFVCGGPHLKRECPNNYSKRNRPPRSGRGHRGNRFYQNESTRPPQWSPSVNIPEVCFITDHGCNIPIVVISASICHIILVVWRTDHSGFHMISPKDTLMNT